MMWNKLPTASPWFCGPALSGPQPQPQPAPRFPPLRPAPPMSPPGFAPSTPPPPSGSEWPPWALPHTLAGACHPGPPLVWQGLGEAGRPSEATLPRLLPWGRGEGPPERMLHRAQRCGRLDPPCDPSCCALGLSLSSFLILLAQRPRIKDSVRVPPGGWPLGLLPASPGAGASGLGPSTLWRVLGQQWRDTGSGNDLVCTPAHTLFLENKEDGLLRSPRLHTPQ